MGGRAPLDAPAFSERAAALPLPGSPTAPAATGVNSSACLACLSGLQAVLGEFQDIRLAFGESDEYSFVFHKDCQLYGELAAAARGRHWVAQHSESGARRGQMQLDSFPITVPAPCLPLLIATSAGRRASKLVSLVTSCFSASYVRFWGRHFPGTPLAATPLFDARAVLYPAEATLRDYLSWRQADTHINNLVGLAASAGMAAVDDAAAPRSKLHWTLNNRIPCACPVLPHPLPCLPSLPHTPAVQHLLLGAGQVGQDHRGGACTAAGEQAVGALVPHPSWTAQLAARLPAPQIRP